MQVLFKIILTIITILYPLAVYFGIKYFEPRMLSLLLVFVFIYFLFAAQTASKSAKYLALSGILVLIIGLLTLNNIIFIKLYPILMNVIFFFMFSYTLIKPPSMVERFARITHKDLPQYVIKYTKNVTIVWCVFLLFNSIISIYTSFWTSLATWTLYNGLISYLLMGTLFIGEYVVRCFVIRRNHK